MNKSFKNTHTIVESEGMAPRKIFEFNQLQESILGYFMQSVIIDTLSNFLKFNINIILLR